MSFDKNGKHPTYTTSCIYADLFWLLTWKSWIKKKASDYFFCCSIVLCSSWCTYYTQYPLMLQLLVGCASCSSDVFWILPIFLDFLYHIDCWFYVHIFYLGRPVLAIVFYCVYLTVQHFGNLCVYLKLWFLNTLDKLDWTTTSMHPADRSCYCETQP